MWKTGIRKLVARPSTHNTLAMGNKPQVPHKSTGRARRRVHNIFASGSAKFRSESQGPSYPRQVRNMFASGSSRFRSDFDVPATPQESAGRVLHPPHDGLDTFASGSSRFWLQADAGGPSKDQSHLSAGSYDSVSAGFQSQYDVHSYDASKLHSRSNACSLSDEDSWLYSSAGVDVSANCSPTPTLVDTPSKMPPDVRKTGPYWDVAAKVKASWARSVKFREGNERQVLDLLV